MPERETLPRVRPRSEAALMTYEAATSKTPSKNLRRIEKAGTVALAGLAAAVLVVSFQTVGEEKDEQNRIREDRTLSIAVRDQRVSQLSGELLADIGLITGSTAVVVFSTAAAMSLVKKKEEFE